MTEQSMFEKNLEMWEKFVSGNMDLMFKSMEKAMEGSQALQRQVSQTVDRAMEESGAVQEQVSQAVNKTLEGSKAFQEQVAKGVSAAVSAQFDLTLKTLKALERQVEHLSEKVDEFIETQGKE
jgi:uncharacterized coiled-coil protein SlyX